MGVGFISVAQLINLHINEGLHFWLCSCERPSLSCSVASFCLASTLSPFGNCPSKVSEELFVLINLICQNWNNWYIENRLNIIASGFCEGVYAEKNVCKSGDTKVGTLLTPRVFIRIKWNNIHEGAGFYVTVSMSLCMSRTFIWLIVGMQ